MLSGVEEHYTLQFGHLVQQSVTEHYTYNHGSKNHQGGIADSTDGIVTIVHQQQGCSCVFISRFVFVKSSIFKYYSCKTIFYTLLRQPEANHGLSQGKSERHDETCFVKMTSQVKFTNHSLGDYCLI